MRFLLSESYNQEGFGVDSFLKKEGPYDLLVEVGPRINIVTAWCTNAVGAEHSDYPYLSIFRSTNITNVRRIEMSKRYLIHATAPLPLKTVESPFSLFL